jgi:hypothetical protein
MCKFFGRGTEHRVEGRRDEREVRREMGVVGIN